MGNRQTRSLAFVATAALGLVAFAPTSGCSSKSNQGTAGDDAGGSGSSSGGMTFGGDDSGAGGITMTCPAGTNFQCQKATCAGGVTTTLTGVVYDPAGKIPLYNAAVYVPNTAPVKLPQGVVSCADCSEWYTAPVVSTITDEGGNFTLKDMPVGPKIPLIVQIGKWRMVYTLSTVAPCVNNDAASLAGAKLRMPRNHTEGDIPNIAVSTGAADSLECLLSRMGVESGEYTGDPKGAGRIHIFQGGDAAASKGGAITNSPQSPQSYQYLWNRDDSMDTYDLVLLSCEGNETSFLNDAGRSVLSDYTNIGGRVFASHFHYSWFTPTGPFSGVIRPWRRGRPGPAWSASDQTAAQNGDIVTTLPNGMPFPEGASMKKWLQNVGALTNGELPIYFSRNNANVTMANTHSQSWVALDPTTPAPNATQYFSFDTPLGVAASETCGRVVYSDLHVSGGAGSSSPGSTRTIPASRRRAASSPTAALPTTSPRRKRRSSS